MMRFNAPISFVATANAASHLGAIPHFIDIESRSLGMDPKILNKHLENIAEIRKEGVFIKETNRKIGVILPFMFLACPQILMK